MPNHINHAWLRQGSTSSEEVEKSYDGWAPTYDDTLAEWDYRAPEEAAIILQSAIPKNSRILDVGCGTGLMGVALRRADFSGPIDGIDISEESLSTAKKCGVYRSLRKVDLQEHILEIHFNFLQPSKLKSTVDDDRCDHAAVGLAVGQRDMDVSTLLL